MTRDFPGASCDAWKEREPDPGGPPPAEREDDGPDGWEVIHDVAYERVRRMLVHGGWLYQTEIDEVHEPLRDGEMLTRVTGWHAPIFVPAVRR